MAKRNVLGKGLGAIFTDLVDEGSSKPAYATCRIDELQPNSFQPRRSFGKDEIAGLADSIKSNGVIQPIIVRRRGPDSYEIITGERRWRAAQKAGLREVPIVVREATDRDLVEWSLIENIQREDLNPIEEAEAYNRLVEMFQFSHEEIARRVGKDRSTVVNALRLLKLPTKVQREIIAGTITAGHARALLALQTTTEQLKALKTILDRKLSVRETERLVKQQTPASSKPKKIKKDDSIRDLENSLSRKLMAHVTLKQRKRGGTIEIKYSSSDELNRIVETLLVVDGE